MSVSASPGSAALSANGNGAARPRFVEEKPALKAGLRNLVMRGVGRLGALLRPLGGRRTPGQLGILTYHRVFPAIAGLPPLLHNVEPARMREQLLGLKRRGYRFLSLHEALRASRQGKFPDRAVVVTFDDGFENVLTRALPILREAEVPATVFVNTGYLDSQAPFPFDAWGMQQHTQAPAEAWRPLTREQCRELQASGLVTLAAHTHTHEDFRGRPEEFRTDAKQSVELVREWFGEEEVLFAFPYGSPQDGFAGGELRAAIMQTGAACALTTDTLPVAPGSDPFHWGRFNVFSWDTSASLAGKLDGYYSWAPALWRRAIGRREPTPADAFIKRDDGGTPAIATQAGSGLPAASGKLPLRVAYLTNFVSPHVAPVLREIASRVEALTVFVSTQMEADRTWHPDWQDLDVRVQRTVTLGNPKRHALGFRLSNYIHFPWDTLLQLAALRPDVIVTSEMGGRTIFSTLYARLLRRTALVHDCSLSEHTEQGVGWLKTWIRRRLARQADHLVSSGSSGIRYLQSLGVPESRVSLFPNAALPLFHAGGIRPASERIRRILCVGQLIERKGVSRCVDGLAKWLEKHPDRSLELWLAGDGPERERLIRRALPTNLQIIFLGNVSAEKLRPVYEQVDLFALPTLADEWGLVTDEALWSGLPVLGSIYAQSVLDLIEPGTNGWSYDPLQPEDLERALTQALETPRERLSLMRKAARASISQRTPAFAADCFLQAVQAACGRAASRRKR
jgi:glycosyltransferase involved in cell wall biosynthesis/peptidoglycan/xylan/chitin deacetylase (PgdA/CDA1 family)